MESKNDIDSSKVFLHSSTKAVLVELSNIQIVIDVIATRLIECRKLRLDKITTNEISNLEGKLIKHISQQLDAKQKISFCETRSELRNYPCMKNFLTLAGVGKPFADYWKKLSYSVEDVLRLSDLKLESLLEEIGDNENNKHKFLTAVSLLRKYNCYNSCDNAQIPSRKNSINSGSVMIESGMSAGKVQIDLINPSETYTESKRHFKLIPSTSSSSMTPPSPTQGSHSSLDTESDSAFSISYNQGSPPPRVAMNVTPSTSSVLSPTSTSPLTPVKASPILKQSNFTQNREASRSRFPSTGSKSAYSTLAPTAKLKTSKSTEWNIGNKVSLSTSMSGSNQSLTSIASHSSPSLPKHSKAKRKKDKRPPNLTVDTQVNFISLSRPATHGSTTVSPDGADNSSPLSPRTPATPLTPSSSEMPSRDRDLFHAQHPAPRTPKTPKSNSNFKAVKKFFRTKIKKLKRIKSTEQLQDLSDDMPPMHRKRSGTLPSRKSNLLSVDRKPFPASNPNSTCVTPLGSPDFNAVFNNDSNSSSSRRPSLIDTDKTIVAENHDEIVGSQQGLLSIDVKNDDLADDEPLTKGNLFRQGSQLMNSEEWDILYEDLTLNDEIGSGRVGTVYKGYWHGDVAIRVIEINHNDEEKLRAFKQEIGVFKKTRHENLELFMGSCMHPPRLAIVTGLCRGHSLYNYIRDVTLQSTNTNHIKIVAQQTAQGMGYLHSRGIVHKDLKSKNIFVDGKRVVITGFGLVGLNAMARENSARSDLLDIPNGWLCYLAPELMLSLTPPRSTNDDHISTLPYTTMTDIYAFGTVWYELLTGSWPFVSFPAESIIYQVGSGRKQNLGHLHGVAKELLVQCWSSIPSQRPDFSTTITSSLETFQQSQIQRSLSTNPRRPGPSRSPSHDRLFDRGQMRHSPFLQDLAE